VTLPAAAAATCVNIASEISKWLLECEPHVRPQSLQVCATRGDRIDLVLSDVIMPGMGGRELARELGARRPGLEILFMSGYNDDSELSGVDGEVASGVLAKPFTAETLARQVREALDRRSSATQPRGAHIA